MRTRIFWLATVCALVLVPSTSFAQAKVRIAVWEFDNNAEHSWWFYDKLGPAARNQIDNAFGNDQALNNKFSMIERAKLDLVMKEQGLGAAGALDPQSAAKIGRVLGIKYIVTGGIDKFAINNTRGAIGRLGVGGNMVQAEATISLRFIDTTTAERVVSVSADGEVKKGGGFVRGTSLSRDAEWGIASEAVEKASQAVVAKLVSGGYLAKIGPGTGAASGLEGMVAKVDGTQAYINIGSSSGVKVGDKFTVFSVGDAIVDPATGMSLGATEKQTGAATVTEVNERFSIITLSGTAKVKDVVRKQ